MGQVASTALRLVDDKFCMLCTETLPEEPPFDFCAEHYNEALEQLNQANIPYIEFSVKANGSRI